VIERCPRGLSVAFEASRRFSSVRMCSTKPCLGLSSPAYQAIPIVTFARRPIGRPRERSVCRKGLRPAIAVFIAAPPSGSLSRYLTQSKRMLLHPFTTFLGVVSAQESLLLVVEILAVYGRHVSNELRRAQFWRLRSNPPNKRREVRQLISPAHHRAIKLPAELETITLERRSPC
jgi:hypothetical protein